MTKEESALHEIDSAYVRLRWAAESARHLASKENEYRPNPYTAEDVIREIREVETLLAFAVQKISPSRCQ